MEEDEFFERLASGTYRNIIVLTGAGISTAAGVPDYRSGGGFFETFQEKYSDTFPDVSATPETLFSRSFVRWQPDFWKTELLPAKQAMFKDLSPTLTHKFCAYMAERGWLKRIYTQNIDGLHSHPSLGIDEDRVVECHGSILRGDLVLYGDPLPRRFFDMVSKDFDPSDIKGRVDLILVMGTSLQVAPFCALPNLAPKGASRVLVNRNLMDCARNSYSASSSSVEAGTIVKMTMKLAGKTAVPLESLWMKRDKIRKKKWTQLLVQDYCDDFVSRFMQKTETEI